jgi:hypothetical protein
VDTKQASLFEVIDSPYRVSAKTRMVPIRIPRSHLPEPQHHVELAYIDEPQHPLIALP